MHNILQIRSEMAFALQVTTIQVDILPYRETSTQIKNQRISLEDPEQPVNGRNNIAIR